MGAATGRARRSSADGRRAGRLASAALLVAALATLLLTGTAGAQSDDGTGNRISIVRTPSSIQGLCLPEVLALSRAVVATPTTVTLHIFVGAPLCEPIQATAAVYAMAGNGAAWPQRLVEATPFTLSEAGRIEITFTKTCRPVQFDVVTGATPEVISPFGEHHGPLLFPFDTSTALQHWGSECVVEEPIVVPPTSTPTSTTPPPEVQDFSTTVLPVVTTLPMSDVDVLGATEVAEAGSLAFTGGTVWSLLLSGATCVFAGLSLVSLRRHRARR